jgi:cobalt-zinc-cadmium efflux system outer membrane protein
MNRRRSACGPLLLSLIAAGAAAFGWADPPVTPPAPPVLPLDVAVHFALEHNPQLAAVRTQRNLAAAGVVLARVYPYNPIYSGVVLGDNGPAASGVTNHVFNEHYITLQLELCGQRKARMAAAAAAVTRTEWEIAAQELANAIAAIRAYDTVLYRQQKLQVLEETVRLNEQVVDQGKRLVEFGRLRPADVILARTELDAARAQRGQGRAAVAVARAELRRQLGTLDDAFAVGGELDLPLPALDPEATAQAALRLRPEIQARGAAIAEAEARLRLQVADRFGNLSIGPRYEINETSDTFVGVVMNAPIPVFNRRQGEILQRRADLARAHADLRATEVQVAQAVQAALARLTEARKWAADYPAEVLPDMEKARQDMDKLFTQNEPGVDVIRVLGVQRNLLRATDAYLDARFEVSQAVADLAAAVGDPALAVVPGPAAHADPPPAVLPPPAPDGGPPPRP